MDMLTIKKKIYKNNSEQVERQIDNQWSFVLKTIPFDCLILEVT